MRGKPMSQASAIRELLEAAAVGAAMPIGKRGGMARQRCVSGDCLKREAHPCAWVKLRFGLLDGIEMPGWFATRSATLSKSRSPMAQYSPSIARRARTVKKVVSGFLSMASCLRWEIFLTKIVSRSVMSLIPRIPCTATARRRIKLSLRAR